LYADITDHTPAFLHGGLERREVDLLEGPLVDLLVDAMPFEFLIVGGEMLHAGDDAFALHALDIADNEARGEIRDLRRTLRNCGPTAAVARY
jgi:hypothetical protein